MSRSFKAPYMTDYSRGKSFFKRKANRRIRDISVDKDIADGGSYRKFSQSYDICDWKFRYNPYPRVHVNYRTGELEWDEPDPIYRYNRK